MACPPHLPCLSQGSPRGLPSKPTPCIGLPVQPTAPCLPQILTENQRKTDKTPPQEASIPVRNWRDQQYTWYITKQIECQILSVGEKEHRRGKKGACSVGKGVGAFVPTAGQGTRRGDHVSAGQGGCLADTCQNGIPGGGTEVHRARQECAGILGARHTDQQGWRPLRKGEDQEVRGDHATLVHHNEDSELE